MPKHIYAVHNHTESIENRYRHIIGATGSDREDAHARSRWIEDCLTSILSYALRRHPRTIDTIIEIVFPEFTCRPFTGAYRCCADVSCFQSCEEVHDYFSNTIIQSIKRIVHMDQSSHGTTGEPYPGRITVLLGSVVTIEPLLDKIPSHLAAKIRQDPTADPTGVRNVTILTTYTPPHLHRMLELYETITIPKLKISFIDFIRSLNTARSFSAICANKLSPVTQNDILHAPGLGQLSMTSSRAGRFLKSQDLEYYGLTIDGICHHSILSEIYENSALRQEKLKSGLKWKDFFDIKKHLETKRFLRTEKESKKYLESSILSGERSFFSATSPSSGCIQDVRVCLDHALPLSERWQDVDDPSNYPFFSGHDIDSKTSGLPFASELIITSAGIFIDPNRLGRLANHGTVICVDGFPERPPRAYRMESFRRLSEVRFQNITSRLSQLPQYACALAPTKDAASQILEIYSLENLPTFDVARLDVHFEAPMFCLTTQAHIGTRARLLSRHGESTVHKIASGEHPKCSMIICTSLSSTADFYAEAETFAIQQREQAVQIAKQKLRQRRVRPSTSSTETQTYSTTTITNPYDQYKAIIFHCISCGREMTAKDYILLSPQTPKGVCLLCQLKS